MKLLKFLKKILILGTVTLALTSCQNNIFNIEEDKSPHLVISSSSRTAKPFFSMPDFDTIILTGTYNSENYELGEWTTDDLQSAYDKLSKAYIPLPYTGDWIFTLNAIKTGKTETETDTEGNITVIENRTLFSDSMNITVTEGANSIKFELDVVEYDTTGTGNIFVTLSLKEVPNDEVDMYTVKATLAPFSNLSDTTEYEAQISNDGDNIYASLSVDNIDSGIYLATFNVSKGSYSNVATKTTIITITNGVTSKIDSEFFLSNNDISSAITASEYTITYNTNGGTWENDDYVSEYNAYNKDDTELPTSKDITYNGYTFEGWYKSNDSSKKIITKIEQGTHGNLSLEAKWQDENLGKYAPVSNITYSAGSLNWPSVDGATSYYIYRISDSEGSNLTQIAETQNTSYNIVPYFLEGYYYGVRADSDTDDENTTNFSDAIKLSHIVATPIKQGNDRGIYITLTLEPDEILPKWSKVTETKSNISLAIGDSSSDVFNELNNKKVFAYTYPYTKEDETYNFSFYLNYTENVYDCSATATTDSGVYIDTSALSNATLNISYDYLNKTVTETLDLTQTEFENVFSSFSESSDFSWRNDKYYFYYGNTSWNPCYKIASYSDPKNQEFSNWTNSVTYTVSPKVNFSDYGYQYFGWHDFNWSLTSNEKLIWFFRTNSVTFDYINSDIATEVVGTWKDNSSMFDFSDSGVYYGYTLNSGKYSYSKGTYSTSNDYIVIAVEYEGINEYDEEQILSDISWKKLSETKYKEYSYTYDTSTEHLSLKSSGSGVISWVNTSNETYYFEQSGTTWKSNNQGKTNSTAESTWTLEVPIGVGSVSYNFNYSVSSESGYDKLSIKLDGVTVCNNISGEKSDSCTKTLSEGTHTLTATYSKDGSQDANNDCGTITLNPVPVPTIISLTKI